AWAEELSGSAVQGGNRRGYSGASKHRGDFAGRPFSRIWRAAVVSGQPKASRSEKSQHRLHDSARVAVEDVPRSRLCRPARTRTLSKLRPELESVLLQGQEVGPVVLAGF